MYRGVILEKQESRIKLIIVLLFISSFSLLFSLFGDYNGNFFNVLFGYAMPVLFLGFMAAAYVMLFFVNKERKIVQKKEHISSPSARHNNSKSRPTKGLPGAIRIFSNKYATIFDLLSALFLVLTIVFSFIPLTQDEVSIICLSVLVFCLHMHCLLNGVNFTYIFYNNKRGERQNEKD